MPPLVSVFTGGGKTRSPQVNITMQRPDFDDSKFDSVSYYLDLVEYWLTQHDNPLAAANAASYARIAEALDDWHQSSSS